MTAIKNWSRFQHFKDRRPPWIKLYRDLLDDPEWHELDDVAAKTLVMLWLIASEANGQLPDVHKLSFRLRIPEEQLNQRLTRLSHWLILDDIATISTRYQVDAPETERETETEKMEPAHAGSSSNSKYAFESGVIRLTEKDFNQWKKAYRPLNLEAELLAMSEWAGKLEPGRWFHAIPNVLAKRTREVAAAVERGQSAPPFKWNGIEGVV